MTRRIISVRSIGLSLLVSACALGCAHVAPKELVDAREAFRGASKGPAAQYNPAQLHTAQQSLSLAEKTFEEEGDSAAARDRAYVAMRKAQLADTQARISALRTQQQAGERAAQQQQAEQLAGTKEQLEQEAERRRAAEAAAQKASEELARLASVKQEQRGLVITLSGSVLFASDKAELLPSAQQRLADVAKALNEGNPEAQLVVEGHTDSQGSASYNLDLSARRAEAVRTFLVGHGVDTSRIRAQGLGLTRPVADNKSAEGRANNRRVEIVVQPTGA